MTAMLLLGAVAAGWLLQLVLAHRQAEAFRRSAAQLRPLGTVSVGVAGRRYRGGRAYVALAVDRRGRVRGATVLRGLTTFARPRPLPGAVGLRADRLAGPAELPGLDRLAREACRQAVVLMREPRTDEKEAPLATPAQH